MPEMKPKAAGDIGGHPQPIEKPRERSDRCAIQKREEGDPVAMAIKLLGDFKSNQSAHRVSAQIVRSGGLERADFLNIMGGHGLDCGVPRRLPIQPDGLDAVNRLI